jgi:hypothetical protein
MFQISAEFRHGFTGWISVGRKILCVEAFPKLKFWERRRQTSGLRRIRREGREEKQS